MARLIELQTRLPLWGRLMCWITGEHPIVWHQAGYEKCTRCKRRWLPVAK